ncbi:MAG: preprotein translocase subunit YajC [Acidiferrobacterales bacterium]
MNLLISDAHADVLGAASGPGGGILGFLPLIVIFAIFYFLLIRPQSKRAKEHKAMVAAIAKGDEVVTNGGVLGRVTEVGEAFVTVEVADGVSVKLQRHAIATLMPKGTIKST